MIIKFLSPRLSTAQTLPSLELILTVAQTSEPVQSQGRNCPVPPRLSCPHSRGGGEVGGAAG